MKLNPLVSSVLATAEAVLPLLVPGSATSVAAVRAVVDLIDKTQSQFEELSTADAAQLADTRKIFEAAVNNRVDETIDRLTGE